MTGARSIAAAAIGARGARRGVCGGAAMRRRAARLAALLMLAAVPCGADGLDSLRSFVDGAGLFVRFAIPARSLREARLETTLEDQGLDVDCVVSTEIREKGRFIRHTVVREVVRRRLSYSRWYEEYTLSENGQDVATHKSYYPILDRFRRFERIRVVDLGILEAGREYTLDLEVSLVPRLPGEGSGVKQANLSGMVPRGVLPKELVDVFRGRGSLLSIRKESPVFRAGELPERLFGVSMDEAGARAATPAGATRGSR